jgi:hypothetical protein
LEVLFNVHAVTCKNIRTTTDYWRYIIEVKHPESFRCIAEKAAEMAMETLSNPEVVVREKIDPSVYLYYRRFLEYFICVIAKHREMLDLGRYSDVNVLTSNTSTDSQCKS